MPPSHLPSALRTQRLLLRSAGPGDGAAVHAAVVESLPGLRAWPTSLPWALYEPSVDASEHFCQQSAQAFDARTGFAFLAFDAQGALVGSVGLHDVRWDIPAMEVGFWMRSSTQRQGYAREALGAVLHFAQAELGARRVEARTDEDNTACRATCASAGMQLEGILRNARITPSGQLKNGCVYAAIPATHP